MIYADTNAIVSLLVPGRDEGQRASVEWARSQGPVIVSEAVLAEMLWVLEDGYGFGKADAATLVQDVLAADGIDAWDPELADGALALMARFPALGIVDCLLAQRAERGHVILTFDRRLARVIER